MRRSEDDAALRDIYDRMNNAGKRLSRAEAFWGLHAPDEREAASLTSLATLQEHVQTALNWGRIDDDTILRIFLARRGHDVTRDIHQEFDVTRREQTDFPGEDKETAHSQALEALDRTVRFLTGQASVPHVTFLAYRYLLVVLARFFAHFPDPDPRKLELLRRWYWRAALAGPNIAKGSVTGAMRVLCACVRPGDESGSVQFLLAAVPDRELRALDPYRFRTNTASGHMILCAVWDHGPVSPDDGSPFTRVDLALAIGTDSSPAAAVPALIARPQLPDDLAAAVGNRFVLPGVPIDAFRALLDDDVLFARDGAQEIRSSHFASGNGTATEPHERVRERTERVTEHLAGFLRRMTGDGLEHTRPLADFDLDEDNEGIEVED